MLSRDALEKCEGWMRASFDIDSNSIPLAHAWLWEMGKRGFSGGWKKISCVFICFKLMESVWLDVDLLCNVSLIFVEHFFRSYDLPKTCMFLHVRWI